VSQLKSRSVLTVCIDVVLIGCMALGQAIAEVPNPTAAPNADKSISTGPKIGNPDSETTTSPNLKRNPIDALRKFEPPADEEYTLGPGDEINLQFPGRPELSSKHVIGPDGRITLMVAGPIEITNLTREAAARKIADALSSYYANLTGTVEVEKYGSNHINLLGNVRNPGVMNFDQTPTLLEALSRGGIETNPNGTIPDRCVIYRGDQVVWVDLQGLLESGSPLADLRLRRNDVVFVPSVSDRTVSVMGYVEHPGEIVLKHNSNLVSIIGAAGGPSDNAGSDPEIEVVHRSKEGKIQYFRLKELLAREGGLDVSLEPGDVIYVSKSNMAKLGFVLQQLAPFAMLGTFASIAAH
jgi:polysaccharide biosynthesis/export protein